MSNSSLPRGTTVAPEVGLLAPAEKRVRVWIDTDASCASRKVVSEVDDCWALLYALKSPILEVVGISTVFGNSERLVSDLSVRRLLDEYHSTRSRRSTAMPVLNGAMKMYANSRNRFSNKAARALKMQLEEEPLTIVALGPLTNIAMLLMRNPELSKRITRIIAVGGQRQTGKLRPYRGAIAFRDLNIWHDPEAFRMVQERGVPIVLLPFEAATDLTFSEQDIRSLAKRDASTHWLAGRTQGWLAFWQATTDVGGFHPFDMLAVAYAAEPGNFQCQTRYAYLRYETSVEGRPILFVSDTSQGHDKSGDMLMYCTDAHASGKQHIMQVLDLAPK